MRGERTQAGVRAIRAKEDVAQGRAPARERQLVHHRAADRSEGVAPFYGVPVYRVESGLAQGGAVSLEVKVEQVLVIAVAEGDEELLAVTETVTVALDAGVGLPLLLEVVVLQRAQPYVTPKIEEGAKVAARSEASLALVEDGGDAELVKGEEEGEADRAVADARDGGLSSRWSRAIILKARSMPRRAL